MWSTKKLKKSKRKTEEARLTPESPKVEKYWSEVTRRLPWTGRVFMKLKWEQHTGAASGRASSQRDLVPTSGQLLTGLDRALASSFVN